MKSLPVSQTAVLGALGFGIPLSGWGAIYPPNTWLQVGPVAVLLIAAVPLLPRYPLSDGSILAVGAFFAFHLFAARWTYSDVPYEYWARALDFSIDRTFGFDRNMFDRLVHFVLDFRSSRP